MFIFEKFKECHKKMHILWCLGAILLAVLVAFMIFETRNAIRRYGYIGRAPLTQYTITINGEGKETGTPDVAEISLGVTSEAKTVKSAQDDNTKKMNAIIKAIKDLKVKDADIQTANYSIYPNYSYDNIRGSSAIIGYTVSQSVAVKIRNLDDVGTIIADAGELGANQVGGVQFKIDDSESLKAAAREEAIADAKAKAAALFKELGVSAGRIVSFSEYGSGDIYYSKAYEEYGIGGGALSAPSIETGSFDVTVDVSLTYEIK